MKRYKGYCNYYLNGVLKSYNFQNESEAGAKMIIHLMKLRGKPYVGYLAVEEQLDERGDVISEQIITF